MNRIRTLLTTLLLLALSVPAAVAQDRDKMQFHAEELAPQLWMLSGAGGNHVLAADDEGALLVDADYAGMGEKLLAKIAELAPGGALQVVDTHWHFDHVGGNRALREAGAVIIAQRNVRKRMIAGQHLAVIEKTIPPADAAELPQIVFDDGLTLHRGDETVEILHVAPAHTDGDAIVHFRKANVIHTGDIVFFCGYPFIDLNAGGRIDGVIAAVKLVLDRCDDETKIVPGHGPLTDKAGLQTYLEVLTGFRAAVAKAKADGMTLEQLQESDVTAAIDVEWDNKMFPSAAFRELVYRSLP